MGVGVVEKGFIIGTSMGNMVEKKYCVRECEG
jgi:hypothetical protein